MSYGGVEKVDSIVHEGPPFCVCIGYSGITCSSDYYLLLP